jgi:hypothetical protein
MINNNNNKYTLFFTEVLCFLFEGKKNNNRDNTIEELTGIFFRKTNNFLLNFVIMYLNGKDLQNIDLQEINISIFMKKL